MFKSTWNIEKIKNGFERFLAENGRLPTAREIDKIDYLPTSRTIQREYGGLEKLRIALGFSATHFGKGENRSKIATAVNKRGIEAEDHLGRLLISQFGEMFVHIEKPITRFFKNRIDFYVYSPDGNFGVDVFHPKDLYSMTGSISMKQVSYKDYSEKLYLVVANYDISQEGINKLILNKKNVLKENFVVIAVKDFEKVINKMKAYTAVVAGE